MTTARGTVRSWQFRLLWGGQSVSVVGDGAAMLAIPLLVLTMTGSAVVVAVAATPRTAAYLVAGLVAGPLVDRWDIRRVLIVSDALRGLVFALLPVVVWLIRSAWLVIALAFVAATAGVFFETAMAVAVRDILVSDELVAGNSRLELSSQLGLLLGPSLIGLAIATFGVDACLWLNASTFAVSVLTLLPLRFLTGDAPAAARLRGQVRQIGADLAAGMRYIRGHGLIARVVTLQAVINFVIAAEALVVFLADRSLHASPAWIGVVLAAGGAGGIAAATVARWFAQRFAAETLIAWAVALLGGSLLGLATAHDPYQLAAANAAHGALAVFATVHIRAIRQREVPREMLGRVTANARTLAFMANPLGAALFGGLTQAAGGNARWALLTAAVLSLASTTVAYRGLLRVQHDPVSS